jgi:hypothetical protein
MNTTQMPTSQDTRIEEAFGQPLAVLYARAAAGSATPGVQRALELRSFLAVIEDQAAKTRERVHQATRPADSLYGISPADLRFDVSFLEATLKAGVKHRETLEELLRATPAVASQPRRPVRFTQAKAAAVSVPGSGLTAQPGAVQDALGETGAGRHRR